MWNNYDRSVSAALGGACAVGISCFRFLFQQQALAGALVAGAGSVGEADPFKRQQAGPPAGTSPGTGSRGLRDRLASSHGRVCVTVVWTLTRVVWVSFFLL